MGVRERLTHPWSCRLALKWEILLKKKRKKKEILWKTKNKRKRILTLSDSTHFISAYAQGKTLVLVDLERKPKRKGSGVRDRENAATWTVPLNSPKGGLYPAHFSSDNTGLPAESKPPFQSHWIWLSRWGFGVWNQRTVDIETSYPWSKFRKPHRTLTEFGV